MGSDRRLIDSGENEALVTAALDALKVELIDSAGVSIEDLETALNNLEEALHSVNTDYLKVQSRDAAGNLMPSMDAVTRKGFVAITDGTDTLGLLKSADALDAAVPMMPIATRRTVSGAATYFPSAFAADSNISKGAIILPVTPMTRQNEEGARIHTNDACFVVSYEVESVVAKTGYVLVDLSNATNYPHTATTEIHVDWLSFSMLGDVTAEGHVKIGFISAIDAEKGTMKAFVCKPVDKGARTALISRQYNPSAIRCKTAAVLAGGGMNIVDDTTFQTDVELAGTYTAVAPALGDLVMLIDWIAGSFETVSVTIGYHTI